MSILHTLDRGLTALDIISQSPEGVSAQQLADFLEIHRAAAYRILETLEIRRFVTKGGNGCYRLGSEILAVSHRFMNQYRTAVQPMLQHLASSTSMTAFVTVADAGEAVALAVAEPPAQTSIGVRYQVGLRHPLDRGADGVAILAARPKGSDELETVKEARRLGYSITAGEIQSGAVGMAVALPAAGPGVEASVGVIRLGSQEDMDRGPTLRRLQAARDSLA